MFEKKVVPLQPQMKSMCLMAQKKHYYIPIVEAISVETDFLMTMPDSYHGSGGGSHAPEHRAKVF